MRGKSAYLAWVEASVKRMGLRRIRLVSLLLSSGFVLILLFVFAKGDVDPDLARTPTMESDVEAAADCRTASSRVGSHLRPIESLSTSKTVCLHRENELLLGWDHAEQAQRCTVLTRFRLPEMMA